MFCHPERATYHAETTREAGSESRDPLLQGSAGYSSLSDFRGSLDSAVSGFVLNFAVTSDGLARDDRFWGGRVAIQN